MAGSNEEEEFAIAGALHRWITEGEYVQKKGDSSLGQWARDVAVRFARGKWHWLLSTP